jgi:hypothetical protein
MMCARAATAPSRSGFTNRSNRRNQWQAAVEARLLVVDNNGPDHDGAHRRYARAEPERRSRVQPFAQRSALVKTVMIYTDTSKQVGDANHLKVFATVDAGETWFAENDPEGVAFEYPVEGST